jgi:hypothetical protein
VWRGGLDAAYPLPTLSSVGASIAEPCVRLHTPLIEPDVRVSRFRFSEIGGDQDRLGAFVTLVADVPALHDSPLYVMTGDWFVWLALATLVLTLAQPYSVPDPHTSEEPAVHDLPPITTAYGGLARTHLPPSMNYGQRRSNRITLRLPANRQIGSSGSAFTINVCAFVDPNGRNGGTR